MQKLQECCNLDIIAQFISRYRKEYDFYEQACRMAAQVLESSLQSAGIRAIVTSRAKNPTRLEDKVRQRAQSKNYGSVDEIYSDIVDLAGIRVALYFPAERDEVGKTIEELFELTVNPKKFPTNSKASYEKRFSGYWATHYRVQLSEDLLNESQKRYREAVLEIQVASVLMHAWSEVEHDLVYKPLQGKLSQDEYAILDELNGLVLAGEIALERLQRAGEVRVSSHDREYTSHYDLASSLIEMARAKLTGLNIHDSLIGRVDLLFQLLRDFHLNKPEDLSKYIEALHVDFEKRPLAEQVIDQVLSEDATRFTAYEKIRAVDSLVPAVAQTAAQRMSKNEATGEFMLLWSTYDKLLKLIARMRGYGNFSIPVTKFLPTSSEFTPNLSSSHDRLRHFRNRLVHGTKAPEENQIISQVRELRKQIESLKKEFGLITDPPLYTSSALAGLVLFNYDNNNGRFIVGAAEMFFETAWSSAGDNAIHAYSDPPSIETIALIPFLNRIEDIVDAAAYDTSSRVRTPQVGDIVLWKNIGGFYLATKIEFVTARSHGSDKDELIFSYKIAQEHRSSFT
jgi:ppGpp synthetase/RelA/SpoT-type nucleotidyltranferase